MAAASHAVRRGALRYLLRLFRAGFLAEPDIQQYASRLELPLEPEDLLPSPSPDPRGRTAALAPACEVADKLTRPHCSGLRFLS